MVSFSTSLADPEGSMALVTAVQWVQGALLGTVATTIAVVMVATVGLMMLSGRVNYRHGATIILGCFVLFGAPSIVAGLRATVSDSWDRSSVNVSVPPAPEFAPPQKLSEPAGSYDPYAGASVPGI